MSKLLPPYLSENCKSNGERLLFNILKNAPYSKDWIILHSLNISEHAKRLYGEIDFLILIPNGGIFVMEVKGGDVKCKDGVWSFTDRFNKTHTKNFGPFTQARDAMFSLKTVIEKEFGKGHKLTKVLMGFLCAFPQISFDKPSIENEPWQVLDKDVVNGNMETFFENLVKKFIDKHKNQKWFSIDQSLPTVGDLNQLCDFLRGDFERIRGAKDHLSVFENQVKSYTKEQFRILDSIQLNERTLTQGSAGTGKTMIAIESAIRAAEEDKRVFLTCYNRIIGEWMQKQVENWKDKITVCNLHSYLFEISKGFDYDESQSGNQDFYTKYLPSLLKEMFNMGIAKKFDKLIIDEGQDLIREEYFGLFNSMVHGGMANGNWEIYGDFEQQAIYSQLSKEEMFDLLKKSGQHSNFQLKINCRNTKEIGEETSLISGFEKPPFLLEYLEGLPVAYHFYKDEEHQKKILTELLRKFTTDGLTMNEMVILSTRKLENSCVKKFSDYPIKEIKSVNDTSSTQNYFGFATVQSYKGMESNYVFITDIDDLSSDTIKSLMYVAMSRAKYGLVLLLSESTQSQYYEILKNKLTKNEK